MSNSLEELSVYLRESRGEAIVSAEIAWGELNVTATVKALRVFKTVSNVHSGRERRSHTSLGDWAQSGQ